MCFPGVRWALVPLLGALACQAHVSKTPVRRAGPAPAVSPPSGREAPAPEPARVRTASAKTGAPSASPVLMELTAPWGGARRQIVLRANGQLQAGSAKGVVSLTEAGQYEMGKQARLDVVSLGHPKYSRAILVSLPIADSEDPPNRYQLYVADGAELRRVLDLTVGVYGVTPLEFPGDGAVRYQESGWTACQREKHPKQATRDVVTFRMTDGTVMSESDRRGSPDVQQCSELAACPFVYVVKKGQATKVGEILRNLRGKAAYGRQQLALPSITSKVHIQIREEKREVTYLDAISLEVDGHRVEPESCKGQPSLPYCRADHRPLRLGPGDVLDVWFKVPRTASRLSLTASGYYLPTPTLNSPRR